MVCWSREWSFVHTVHSPSEIFIGSHGCPEVQTCWIVTIGAYFFSNFNVQHWNISQIIQLNRKSTPADPCIEGRFYNSQINIYKQNETKRTNICLFVRFLCLNFYQWTVETGQDKLRDKKLYIPNLSNYLNWTYILTIYVGESIHFVSFYSLPYKRSSTIKTKWNMKLRK